MSRYMQVKMVRAKLRGSFFTGWGMWCASCGEYHLFLEKPVPDSAVKCEKCAHKTPTSWTHPSYCMSLDTAEAKKLGLVKGMPPIHITVATTGD